MKSLRWVISLSTFALVTACLALPAAADTWTSAPADEYFGHEQMSVLGIRNVLSDLAKRLGENPAPSTRVIGLLATTEDAVRDWEHKYPSDPWLAKSVYGLEQDYALIDSPDSQQKTHEIAGWLVAKYPASEYAESVRVELGVNATAAVPSQPVQDQVADTASVQDPSVPIESTSSTVSQSSIEVPVAAPITEAAQVDPWSRFPTNENTREWPTDHQH